MSKWREAGPPDDQAWRCPPGLTAAERTAEQDQAAGGHANRVITIDGRTVLASVALRRKRDGRRVYAYLRWSANGKTAERYLGEVDQPTRPRNLAQAWRLTSALAHPAGPAGDRADSREELPPESWASSPAVRAVMRGNKGKDTRPELAVRSAAHALGLRYRVGVRPLPDTRRTADLVFPKAKVAVFVDGCFWHGCPDHYRPASRNAEFWTAKIAGNIERDADTDARLTAAGWRVIRVWEHEPAAIAARKIMEVVTSG
ncbi:MAG: very short patch repair endonuclease [Actinomycetota bacterium]|nr:very short patch repair endonuclease [Actinomycetota bacterium]